MVSYHKSLSQATTVNTGVPQSTWSIVVNCLYKWISFISSSSSDLLADDCTIYTNNGRHTTLELSLQQKFHPVVRRSIQNHMLINISNTKSMLIAPRQKLYNLNQSRNLHLYIGYIPTESVTEHEVLGIPTGRNLTFHSHQHELIKQTARKFINLGNSKFP